MLGPRPGKDCVIADEEREGDGGAEGDSQACDLSKRAGGGQKGV